MTYIQYMFRHSDAVNTQFYMKLDKHKDALPIAGLLYTSSTRGTSALLVQRRPAGSKCTLRCEQMSLQDPQKWLVRLQTQ